MFPGEVAPSQVAAIWVPDGSLADEHQRIRSEFLWAALDCPGYFAVEEAAGLALLGRMTAVVEDRVDLGEELIVSGWAIESQGRKHSVGTAVHRANGEVVAKARSIWITLAG